MHGSHPRDSTLAIEIPSMFRRRTITFTTDYVTDGRRTIYYNDATKMSYFAELHSVNYIPTAQYYSFMVGSADQEIRVSMATMFYIGNAKRNHIWQKLAAIASQAIQPHIVEKLLCRIFVNVEAVRIDNLELTREGYSRSKIFGGRKYILWTEARCVPTLDAGYVSVKVWKSKNDRPDLFAWIPMSTPNAVLLPQLMEACVKTAMEKSSRQDGGQNNTRRGDDDRYHLEISFFEAIRGATKYLNVPGRPALEIVVPPGVDNGHMLRVQGSGCVGDRRGKPGDSLIEITVKPHPSFTRKGLDIWSDVQITKHDAVSGATIEVPTLDGYAKVRVPEGSVSGQILRLRGNGVICSRSRAIGHQLIRLAVGEDTAQPQPAGAQKNDALETEFKNVFFNKTSADRERIISNWMNVNSVDRTEAMRLAIEDWRADNRRTG